LRVHEKGFRVPAGERQLFLDDDAIESIQSLKRTMHPPSKKGAVIRPDITMGGAPQIRTGVIWDPQKEVFKLWTLVASEGVKGCSGYHESRDGIHWTQPVVGQVECGGSLENHYVCYPFEKGETLGPHSVVYDPHDRDLSRRYKGLSYYRPRHILVPAISPDGIHWRRLDVPPIPSFDEFNLSHDGIQRQFLATVKVRGPYGRCHALTKSQDFEHWTEPELIFHADELDQDLGREYIAQRFADPALQQPALNIPDTYNVDVYNLGLFRYESLYIGLPAMFHKTGQVGRDWRGFDHWQAAPEEHVAFRRRGEWTGFHHIQLVCSRDLRRWKRLGERRPFLDLSPLGAGAYDLATVLSPSYPVVRGDQLWFYYTALKQYGGPSPVRGVERDRGAVCLAVLRRDGFVSLDADDEEGQVTTSPLCWVGEKLYLNGIATGGGIACEFLNSSGSPIPGFARADCVPFTGDSTCHVVDWKAESRLPPAAMGPARLRIYLRRAQLFSFWFE